MRESDTKITMQVCRDNILPNADNAEATVYVYVRDKVKLYQQTIFGVGENDNLSS